MRAAAIDVGNDTLKGIFGDMNQRMMIPNVIKSVGSNRNVVEYESNVLDGLHIEITSSALELGKGKYIVGNLAIDSDNTDEMERSSVKAESDQSVVLLLTALALDAVGQSEDHNLNADYSLSTGLPLRESIQGKREIFKNKLVNGSHQVTFLKTPEHEGKTVKINIAECLVNIEGRSAMIDLTMDEDGSLKNEDLINIDVLINDVGGLSTDAAIIESGGKVDNENSKGEKIGALPYLDAIMDGVRDRFDRETTRREIIDSITTTDAERKNRISHLGKLESIEDIIEDELMKLANEQYKFIAARFERKPSIQRVYQIGGGSLIIKDYLDKINRAKKTYPLRFVNEEDSVWMIVRAYWKLLTIYLAQKEDQKAPVES